jgi:hypothetical protein
LQNSIKIFFLAILLTTILPFITFVFPFIPEQILGFSLTGWAWIIMLLVTLFYLFQTRTAEFPLRFWLPWLGYLIIYLLIDFSYPGLQLTLQYILPVLIGIVVSGFSYSEEDLIWLFKGLIRVCIIIFFMSIYGIIFRGGYGPGSASTAMLFSVSVSILIGLYFVFHERIYLVLSGLLFLVPFFNVTRMGIAATVAIFIFHFANKNIRGKIIYGLFGGLILLLVFNSRKFQEKTFYSGSGELTDLRFNYYDNPDFKTSGRLSWIKALKPGLKAAPIWGNGPRADIEPLRKITKINTGEAHNDYLSVRYNYGYVGLGLLLIAFFTTFLSVYRISKKHSENIYIYIISTSVLTLFISFCMFMYSDNILKYTIFFPNYFFAMIGILYNLKNQKEITDVLVYD